MAAIVGIPLALIAVFWFILRSPLPKSPDYSNLLINPGRMPVQTSGGTNPPPQAFTDSRHWDGNNGIIVTNSPGAVLKNVSVVNNYGRPGGPNVGDRYVPYSGPTVPAGSIDDK